METERAKHYDCEQHYYIYVCCGVRARGDYPFCPEHGGEPMLKCEAEEVL